eukprot:gnl/TRDRNA2_/TRDRNA2_40931_c0_seq2.p1 gnl/TRDRNA2_/TRDRNA2_40931_c0~~gnl/TRDRNA2_/TRDRNA2_40931_c0_seq2.p1  ORF type:complete len:105 (+),score=30.17 gnl/TRDRNA2_/TRDRNA2_40931_c0_seq2:92-406(+)
MGCSKSSLGQAESPAQRSQLDAQFEEQTQAQYDQMFESQTQAAMEISMLPEGYQPAAGQDDEDAVLQAQIASLADAETEEQRQLEIALAESTKAQSQTWSPTPM